MKRKAKIVATIGPASCSREKLEILLRAGMDVARLNFSHGEHSDHRRTIELLRELSARVGRAVAIIADLPGPKIRTGKLRGGQPVQLKSGQRLTLTGKKLLGTAERISINYPRLIQDFRAGDRVLLADGLIELRVERKRGKELLCRVVNGGELGERKGVNLPGVKLSIASLTARDKKHLKFALAHGVDYVAQSFVRSAADVRGLKRLIARLGYDTPVLAKIEKPEALEHLEEILAVADGVMVARGDLGVEMSPEKVPVAQKRIIEMANRSRLPVITATQMLESMIRNPRPTRAEASDVANAVFDGTDALMLSAETATGRYPRETVAMMGRIIQEAEAAMTRREEHRRREAKVSIAETITEAVAHAADRLQMKVIAVFTESGSTARLVSKHRPAPFVIGFSPQQKTRRRMALYWGIMPRRIGAMNDVDALTAEAERRLKEEKLVKKGDVVGIVAGTPLRVPGTTNLLKLHTIGS